MTQQRILGSWKLCSFVYRAEDGSTFYPYGKEAVGSIMYDESGYMSAIISKKDRKNLSENDFGLLPDEEKIELAKGFLAYSGKYEFLNDKILHYVELSYIPNWIGTALERFYKFFEGELILSTPPVSLRGKDYVGYLTWRKAGKE